MQKQDNLVKEVITLEQARERLQAIISLPVSKVFNSGGTAISLDLGRLHKKGAIGMHGPYVTTVGEWTIDNHAHWQLQHDGKTLFDSHGIEALKDDDRVEFILGKLELLLDVKIASLDFDKDSLTITLDKGYMLRFFKGEYGIAGISYNYFPAVVFEGDGIINVEQIMR